MKFEQYLGHSLYLIIFLRNSCLPIRTNHFTKHTHLNALFIYIMIVKLLKMTTRSSRRNAPVQYQQLSFQCARSKNSKKNTKKQINNSSNSAKILIQPTMSNEIQYNTVQTQMMEIATFKKQINDNNNIGVNIPTQSSKTHECRNRKNNFMKNVIEEPIMMNIHHETILKIITHLINHKTFVYIDQPGLRPTANSQIRQMRQKLKASYKLQQFQSDINKIFRVFYQQTTSESTIIQAVNALQYQIKDLLNSKNRQYEQSVTSSQHQSVSFSKTNSKKSVNKVSIKTRQKINQVCKSKTIISGFQQTSFETETRPIQIKKTKRSAIIAPRPKFAKITLLQIATLGFNLNKLPSQQLAMICYKFCDQNQQKADKIVYYNLQLQKMQKESLFELQAYVKNLYKRRNEKYEDVHLQDEYEDFVIQSDGQQTN